MGAARHCGGGAAWQKRSELFYKHSSTLIRHEPEATVDAWILNIALDPVKLIPALMGYNMRTRPRGARNQAIRYVEVRAARDV